ncbi:MAG: hypothetical protein II306_06320 [Clostridia bacterium]|nr:hypothetical protein [Clostridia bacterium]
MKESFLTMIEADEGMVLTKDGNYCSSVLLRKGETSDGWTEITQAEYEEIIAQKEEQQEQPEEENILDKE